MLCPRNHHARIVSSAVSSRWMEEIANRTAPTRVTSNVARMLPDFQTMMRPLLVLLEDGQERASSEIQDALAQMAQGRWLPGTCEAYVPDPGLDGSARSRIRPVILGLRHVLLVVFRRRLRERQAPQRPVDAPHPSRQAALAFE